MHPGCLHVSARHVITDQSDLHEVTSLLRESSVLRLEDVFPLFPDFVTIDQFRVGVYFCYICVGDYVRSG